MTYQPKNVGRASLALNLRAVIDDLLTKYQESNVNEEKKKRIAILFFYYFNKFNI